MTAAPRAALGGLLMATAIIGLAIAPARAANPPHGELTTTTRTVGWSGHLTGVQDLCEPCDTYTLTTALPRSYWAANPGGVTVTVAWPSREQELDVKVFDSHHALVGGRIEGAVDTKRIYLAAPDPGRYAVEISTYTAVKLAYTGRADVVEQSVRTVGRPATAMQFGSPTLVDPQLFGSEPGVWADRRDGRLFVSALGSGAETSLVWRADDSGPFGLLDQRIAGVSDPFRRPCTASLGGSDADVITDRTGRVYMADLWEQNISMLVSEDHGATWTCHLVSTTDVELDRPWLAPAPTADGPGPAVDAYLAVSDLATESQQPVLEDVKPQGVEIEVTRDGGATWTLTSTIGVGKVPVDGPIVVAPDGTVYEVFAGADDGIWVARSTDQTQTFTQHLVSQRLGPAWNRFPSMAVDDAGTVYAAWVDSGTFDALVSASTDRGQHWSSPVRVNPPTAETAVFPWVAAGRAGDVAISWYGTPTVVTPDSAPDTTAWSAWVARSLHADAATPDYAAQLVSETPVRTGPVCVFFERCSRLGDFFKIAIDRAGAVIAVYNDMARAYTPIAGDVDHQPGPFVVLRRQTSGLGLDAQPSRAAAAPPSVRTAAVPELTIGNPSVEMTRSGATSNPVVHFTLGAARDLTRALQAGNTLVATDAYWLTIWKANGYVEYAGMHVGRTGAPDFFGGDRPVGVYRPTSEKYASYPRTLALRGTIDRATRQVSIELPMARFHLHAGDVLHGVQAFSMTSLLDRRTGVTSSLVAGLTAGRTLGLAPVVGSSASPTFTTATPRVQPASRGRLPATGGSRFALPALAMIGAGLALSGRGHRPGISRRRAGLPSRSGSECGARRQGRRLRPRGSESDRRSIAR